MTLTTEKYTEGLCGDGAAILCDGVPMSVSEILTTLNAAVSREAQPVIVVGDDGGDALAYRRLIQSFAPGTKLYTTPPAPAVPDVATAENVEALSGYVSTYKMTESERYIAAEVWNACRAAMLAQPVSGGYKLPPHVYRDLVNSLRDTAVKFSGTEQLRERLNTALSQFIEPDHPHTRTVAPEGGNG